MDFSYLNKEQKEAVITNNQDVLVLAGAGTGKTRVLTARVEYLLEQGVKPEEIVCFTFTNKAAREMKWRINKAVPKNISEALSISTFHSFCMTFLKPQLGFLGFSSMDIDIITEKDQMIVINNILDEIQTSFTNKEILKLISHIKNEVDLKLETVEKEIEINKIFNLYQQKLKAHNKLDIDDIVYYFNIAMDDEMFREMLQTYKHILVDECQDTNPIQYSIMKKMRGKNNNLFLCGDDDQSVYSFRGSDPFLINKFIKEYNPRQIILTKNYRSLPGVIKASSNLIKNNNNRVIKEYEAIRNKNALIQIVKSAHNRHEGIQLCSIINQFHDHGYEFKDIAVLYRNNNIVEHLEPYLMKYKIPYHMPSNKSFLKSEEIELIINYYRLLNNQNDEIALTNLLHHKIFILDNSFYLKLKNEAKRSNSTLFQTLKFFDEQIPQVKYFFDYYYLLSNEINYLGMIEFFNKMITVLNLESYYMKQENGQIHINRINNFKEFLDEEEPINPKKRIIEIINNLTLENTTSQNENDDKVQFMTIHQAKGLEFPIVILPGFEEGIIPSHQARTPLEVEEERRIAYVGVSRAKDNCIIMTNEKRFLYGREQRQKESRFLLEILGKNKKIL